MKKRGISIRYKILLLLTLLPLITLSAYLVLALRIFEDDKIAYVFDSSSSVAGAVAAQIKTQFNGVLGTTKPLFQDYLTQGKFTAISDSIFMNEYTLESVVVFIPSATGAYEKNAILEKVSGQTDTVLASLQTQLPTYFAEVEANRRVVKVPFSDDRVFIFEKVSDETKTRNTVFLVVARMTESAEMFRAGTSQKMYLVSQDGAVLFGPDGMPGKKLQDLLRPKFLATAAARGGSRCGNS